MKSSLTIICIVITSSFWCRAGLGVGWFEELWKSFSFLFGVWTLLKISKLLSTKFILFLALLVLLASAGIYFKIHNATWKSPNAKNLESLDYQTIIASMPNPQNSIFITDALQKIIFFANENPHNSLALQFHFKNLSAEKFKQSEGLDRIFQKIVVCTWKYPSPFLPTLAVATNDFLGRILYFIAQLFIGVIVYFAFQKRKEIRQFTGYLLFGITILAVVGIWQKFSYSPSVEGKEILGIWNTPEPRYFYASFTYKNHWSALAILFISVCIALFFSLSSRNEGKLKTLLLAVSFFSILCSIPHSGSRSGVLIVMTLFVLSLLVFLRRIKLKAVRFKLFPILIILTGAVFVGLMLNKNTTKEMINNSVLQMQSDTKPLRFYLWADLLEQISKKTFWGFGYNSYEAINPIFQSKQVREMREIGLEYSHKKYIPLVAHGHSDILESISEFGWIGFSTIFLPFFFIILRNFIYSKSEFVKMLSAGCLCLIIYCCIDFPTRTPACLIAFSTLVGLSMKYDKLTKDCIL